MPLRLLQSIPTLLAKGSFILVCWAALQAPAEYLWFYNAGLSLWIAEFFSVHASGMLSTGSDEQPKQKGFLVGLYSFFAVLWGVLVQSVVLPLFFLISVLTKAGEKTSFQGHRKASIHLLCFMGSVSIVSLARPFIAPFIPFPAELGDQLSPLGTGFFSSSPLMLPLWGMLYFGSLVLVELVFICIANKPQKEGAA